MILKVIRYDNMDGTKSIFLKDGGRVFRYMKNELANSALLYANGVSAVRGASMYQQHPEVVELIEREAMGERERSLLTGDPSHRPLAGQASRALGYMASKDGQRIVGLENIEEEFAIRSAMRRDIDQPFMHFVASVDPGDPEFTDEQWGGMVPKAVSALVLGAWEDDCRRAKHLGHKLPPKPDPDSMLVVGYRHRDKEHDHIHFLLHRVDANGTVYRGQQWLKHGMNFCREIEKTHDLRRLKTFDQVREERRELVQKGKRLSKRLEHRADRQGTIRIVPQAAIQAQSCYYRAESFEDLVERWKALGLDLKKGEDRRYHFENQSGEIVKANQLGLLREMSIGRIRKRFQEEAVDPEARIRRLTQEAALAARIEQEREKKRHDREVVTTLVMQAADRDGSWRQRSRIRTDRDREEAVDRELEKVSGRSRPVKSPEDLSRMRKLIRTKALAIIEQARVPTARYVGEQLEDQEPRIELVPKPGGGMAFRMDGVRFDEGDVFSDGLLSRSIHAGDWAHMRDRCAHQFQKELAALQERTGRQSFSMQELQAHLTQPDHGRTITVEWSEPLGWQVVHAKKKTAFTLAEIGVAVPTPPFSNPSLRFGQFEPDIVSLVVSDSKEFGRDWRSVRDGDRPTRPPWLRLSPVAPPATQSHGPERGPVATKPRQRS